MSSKLGKSKKTVNKKEQALTITGQFLEYTTAFVMVLMCLFVTFYTSNGYFNIGDDKFEIYKRCMLIGMPLLLLILCIYCIVWLTQKKKFTFVSTDVFVALYLFAVMLAIVCGGFQTDALWGVKGWNMGLLSQLSFALIYLFTSHFGKYQRLMGASLCGSAFFVFLFAILNRMGLDPLGYYAEIDPSYQDSFVSTLGQTSWFGSYVAVVLPIGIVCFIFVKNIWAKIVCGIFSFAGLMAFVFANSESAYAALFAFLLVCFCMSINKAETTFWFFVVCEMFALATRVINLLLMVKPNPYYHPDFLTVLFVTKGNFMWALGALFALLAAFAYWCMRTEKWPDETKMRKVIWCVLGVVGFILLVGAVLVVACSTGKLSEATIQKIPFYSYFVFDDAWGNFRGQTWKFTAEMYANYPFINKLFGVGPDCYNAYAKTRYAERLYEMWGSRALTNAHNEWLNMVVTMGIFGAVCYAGIFVSTMKKCLKAPSKSMMMRIAPACIVSYMAYNFFCYQQVLCTPFVFLIIGLALWSVRTERNGA